MRSPRIVRPHKIIIYNLKPEINYQAGKKTTTLKYVKVQRKLKTKVDDVDVSNRDGIVVVIDCSDMEEVFTPYQEWNKTFEGWTVHPKGDYVECEGINYAIVGHTPIDPFGNKMEFIELLCQRM